jgi:hypothetical protein
MYTVMLFNIIFIKKYLKCFEPIYGSSYPTCPQNKGKKAISVPKSLFRFAARKASERK